MLPKSVGNLRLENPATPDSMRTDCERAANSLRSQTVRGLFGARALSTLPLRAVCKRSMRTVSVRGMSAAYSAHGPRAPCVPKRSARSMRTVCKQYTNSLRSQTVSGLFRGRPPITLLLETVCAQCANSVRRVRVRRLSAKYLAKDPRPRCEQKTVCDRSLRTVGVHRLYAAYFAGGAPNTVRPKTVGGRSLRTICVRKLPPDYFADGPEHPAAQNSARADRELRAFAGCSRLIRPTACEHPGAQRSLPRSLRTVCTRRLIAAKLADGLRVPRGSTQCAK